MADLELRELLDHDDPTQLWFQLAEIVDQRIYLRHGVSVGAGDTVLDVGANVGVAAAFFAVHCGAGLVHCFEPVRPLYERLRSNLRGLPACVPHDYGLSERAATATLTYYPGAAAMSGLYADPDADRELVRRVLLNRGMPATQADSQLAGRYRPTRLSCELRSLSSVLREHSIDRVDLLKIDVEGAELDVLAGIEDVDWARIRQVAAEVHAKEEGRPAAIDAMLSARGFTVAREEEPDMRGTSVSMLYAVRP